MGIGYHRADDEKANRYVESFLCNELSIYSNKVLKKSKLSRIVALQKPGVCRGEKRAGLADLNGLVLQGYSEAKFILMWGLYRSMFTLASLFTMSYIT